MLFAADKEVNKWTIFFGASAALMFATAIGVIAGTLLSEYINEKYLNYLAGARFIFIGARLRKSLPNYAYGHAVEMVATLRWPSDCRRNLRDRGHHL